VFYTSAADGDIVQRQRLQRRRRARSVLHRAPSNFQQCVGGKHVDFSMTVTSHAWTVAASASIAWQAATVMPPGNHQQ